MALADWIKQLGFGKGSPEEAMGASMAESDGEISDAIRKAAEEERLAKEAAAAPVVEQPKSTRLLPGQVAMVADLDQISNTTKGDVAVTAPSRILPPVPMPQEPQLETKFPSLAKMSPKPAPVKQEPVVEAAPVAQPVAEEPKTPDELAEAQRMRMEDLSRNQTRRAFDQLSAGLTGVSDESRKAWTTDTGFMTGQEKIADQRVKDIQEKRTAEQNQIKTDLEKINLDNSKVAQDPMSEMSKAYRDALLQVDPSLKDNPNYTNASAFQIKQLYPMIEDKISFADKREQNRLMAEIRKEAASNKKEQSNDKEIAKLQDTLSKELDPAVPRAGQFGKLYEVKNKADAGLKLTQGRDLETLTDVEVRELASVLDSVLKGGVGTITGTEKLVPKTARGSWNQAIQWARNNPVAANQGGFAKVLEKALARQHERVTDEIASIQEKRAKSPKFQKLRDLDPNAYETQVTMWGLDPDGSAPKKLEVPMDTGMVSVISPNGKPGKIPANKLEAALKAGYTKQ